MTAQIPACTPRDAESVLLSIGFVFRRQKGSHRIYLRTLDKRRVTLPMHNRDLKANTLRSVIRQAGLSPREFHKQLLGKSRGRRVA